MAISKLNKFISYEAKLDIKHKSLLMRRGSWKEVKFVVTGLYIYPGYNLLVGASHVIF